VRDADQLEELVGTSSAFVSGDAAHAEPECDVVGDVAMREQLGLLHQQGEWSAVRGKTVEWVAVDADGSVVRVGETGDDVEQGGLAHTGWRDAFGRRLSGECDHHRGWGCGDDREDADRGRVAAAERAELQHRDRLGRLASVILARSGVVPTDDDDR